MWFLILSHDTQLQDKAKKTSSGSGEGLSYVCICRSFQVGKGIFRRKVSPDGRTYGYSRGTQQGRRGAFSHMFLFFLHMQAWDFLERTWRKGKETSFHQDCVLMKLSCEGVGETILSKCPWLCDPWAKTTARYVQKLREKMTGRVPDCLMLHSFQGKKYLFDNPLSQINKGKNLPFPKISAF